MKTAPKPTSQMHPYRCDTQRLGWFNEEADSIPAVDEGVPPMEI